MTLRTLTIAIAGIFMALTVLTATAQAGPASDQLGRLASGERTPIQTFDGGR